MASTENASADEDLMRRVAGLAEALALLHRRFARLIFGLAAQTLDRATAEELVQESSWPSGATPRASIPSAARSALYSQIAHFRVLNELRRRSRQPDIVPNPEGLVLDGLPARDPGPPEAASR